MSFFDQQYPRLLPQSVKVVTSIVNFLFSVSGESIDYSLEQHCIILSSSLRDIDVDVYIILSSNRYL